MKQILAALLLVLLTVFVSCEPETMLTVDQTSLSYTDAGGSQTITLTANKPWTASSNQSWCKVSPSGGEEATGSRISISCDANTTYDARNATVTITCAELTKQISISQATNNGLLVSQTSYELTKAAQQLNIQVQANVKFSVEVDSGCKNWVKYNSTKGLSTSTVVLDIAENTSYDNREGKVTIKQDGGSLSSTVTIKQSQLDGLFITTPEYNLSNEKHTLTVEVSTNVEFDVKPESDWVKYVQTKGLNTKQIVLEVLENETYDQRETKVNVKQKNGDLSGVLTIKQDEKYGILVSQPEYNLSNEAATIEVEVKYNVDFEVVIPDGCKEWIKQVSTKGLNTKNHTFSIAKNETYDNREGSITFKQKKGSLSETVTIKQAQTDFISIESTEYVVSHEKQLFSIVVHSNIIPDIVIDNDCSSWVSFSSIADTVYNFLLDHNNGTERTGAVTLKGNGIEVVFHIKQMSEGYVDFGYATNLRDYCLKHYDTNNDKKISYGEAAVVKYIDLSNIKMPYLTGIEYFINLEYLDCRENRLKEIDLSNNIKLTHLNCGGYSSHISTLDLSHNTELRYVNVDFLPLGELNLSNNSNIDTLSCIHIGLHSLDVSPLSSLVYLDCRDNFNTTKLDVSQNKKLRFLSCPGNRLTSLDITNNPQLETLDCSDNDLTNLDVTHNPQLKVLLCYANNLTTGINITKNTKLKTFDCSFCRISTSLNASANKELEYLGCYANDITELKLPESVNELTIDCRNNEITVLDVSLCKGLKKLDCSVNHINKLSLSGCILLESLICPSNELTALDISDCTYLTELLCYDNHLVDLDVSKCPDLIELNCWKNNLSMLDVSNNLKIQRLRCNDNPSLKELWLKEGQSIANLLMDYEITTIKYIK